MGKFKEYDVAEYITGNRNKIASTGGSIELPQKVVDNLKEGDLIQATDGKNRIRMYALSAVGLLAVVGITWYVYKSIKEMKEEQKRSDENTDFNNKEMQNQLKNIMKDQRDFFNYYDSDQEFKSTTYKRYA